MVATAVGGCGRGRIRPFVLHRDLSALASLLEVTFDEELALTGNRLVRDMRRMSGWGPFLWLVSLFSPPFIGFVWVEDGRLVGNVSLCRREKEPGVWQISNVAVLPGYRRRGIGGSLVDTALEYIQSRGGYRALLQVRQDNEAATALYRGRGFRTYDVWHEMKLDEGGWPVLAGPLDVRLRPARSSDWRRLGAVARASTAPETLRYNPVRPDDFRRGLGWKLGQFVEMVLNGKLRLELVGEHRGTVVAYGSMEARLFSGAHEISLYVIPEQRGRWEYALTKGLLQSLGRVWRGPVRAYVSESHPEAVEALQAWKFRTLRVLDQMVLNLS